jgi:hypothetical protein
LYVREGLGKQWYETLLDVAGEAGAAVTEAYGGKMAGDAVRAGHKIWTGLAFKDNKGGGGGAPAPPPPPPPPARDLRTGLILGPPPGPPGPMPPPPPPWRPRPRKKKMMMAKKKAADTAPVQGPPPGPAPAPVEAGILGGGSSKGMLIFGVISAVAIGAYLLMQQKKPTLPHEPRP